MTKYRSEVLIQGTSKLFFGKCITKLMSSLEHLCFHFLVKDILVCKTVYTISDIVTSENQIPFHSSITLWPLMY
jgi:hypothetical protein